MSRPNYFGLIPSMESNQRFEFPPQFIICQHCRKGIGLCLMAGPTFWRYACDDSDCRQETWYIRGLRWDAEDPEFAVHVANMYAHIGLLIRQDVKPISSVDVLISCAWCGMAKHGLLSGKATGGFYDLRSWKDFRRDEDELVLETFKKYRMARLGMSDKILVCDACMMNSPKYRAVYGPPGFAVSENGSHANTKD